MRLKLIGPASVLYIRWKSSDIQYLQSLTVHDKNQLYNAFLAEIKGKTKCRLGLLPEAEVVLVTAPKPFSPSPRSMGEKTAGHFTPSVC